MLAGGNGTRLLPLTLATPKALLPIGGQPLLQHILRYLADYGFDEVYVAVSHLSALIADFVAQSSFADNVRLLWEPTPLGTAGALALLPETDDVLVMNGDLLTDIDLDAMLSEHKRLRPAVTVCVRNERVTSDFGVVRVGANGCVLAIDEKPTEVKTVSAGLYVVGQDARRHLDVGVPAQMPDLIGRLLGHGASVHAHVASTHAYWFDIGDERRYRQAQAHWEASAVPS